jgi:hypothetical protein
MPKIAKKSCAMTHLAGRFFFGVVCNCLFGVRGVADILDVGDVTFVGVVVYFFGACILLGDRRPLPPTRLDRSCVCLEIKIKINKIFMILKT